MASRTSTDPIEILLEMGVDLDNLSEEEDYLSALMEAVNTLTIKNASDPRIGFLAEEIRKVRQKRKAADPKFKARKTKISADVFKKGSATGTNVAPKALPTSAIVPYQAPESTEEEGKGVKAKKKKEKPRNILAAIAESVTSIADILKDQYGVKKKSAEFDRKKAEQDKRALQKSKLSKGFEALVKGAQKVIAPVQSLLSRIFGFLFNLLLGKFIMKLLDWIGDPKNREKFFSVVRFLKDNWPKLIALYLVFGNSIGKFIFNLTKTLIGGAVKLTIAIAKLMAAKKIKGARGVAKFLGKRGGLIGAGLATAVTVGGAMAVTNAVAGGGEEQQTQAYFGGGYVKPAPEMQPLPKKVTQERKEATEKSGPLGFISGMSGAQKGMALGSMFGPLGMLAGAGIGSLFDNFGKNKEDKVKLSKPSEVTLEVPAESVDGGQVDGPGGIDKVPAMLTDGEFVMSRGAVQRIGVDKLEAMNAAGGGTNKPKVVDNKVYASVGGYVSGTDTGKKGTPDAKKESSGSAMSMPSMGYRLGQINPETFVTSITKIVEETIEKTDRRRGQGGRPLGDTTRRDGSGFSISESADGFTTTQIDRMVRGGRLFQDKTTLTEITAAIGRPDLIEHQDQILKQLPKGTTIQDVMSGAAIPGVTTEQLARILATSDAQKATNLKEKRARRLDEAIRGIDPTAGYSMSASDMTPALQQAEATANKRHAELMKSTNPEKIAAYDKKHGQGAYSQKLKEKLYRTYGGQATGQTKPAAPTPTGKVVGRENLPSATQKVLARMDAQRAGTLPPDVKTSGPLLGRMAMGMMGGLNNMMTGILPTGANITIKDGNVGTPTAQEQKDFDALAASKANLAQSQKRLAALQPPTPPSNNVQVIKSGGSKGGGESQQSSNGSELPAMNAGNGSKSKFTLLGISF